MGIEQEQDVQRLISLGRLRFKAPEPVAGEFYDTHIHRLTQAVEDWVNARLPVDSTDQP